MTKVPWQVNYLFKGPVFGSSYQARQHLHGTALATVMFVMTRVLHQPLQVGLEHLQEPVPIVPE